MASWNKGYDPELISQRLQKAKQVSDDGKVSFSSFGYSENTVLMNSMICLSTDVPEIEKRRIIGDAVFKAGTKGEISAKKILCEINKLEREYLSTPEEKFRLLTDISISPVCQLPKVFFDGSCIVMNPRLNKMSRNEREKLKVDAKHTIMADLPQNYVDVSVSVTARSTADAVDKALDRLDFIRGIWNLWENQSHNSRRSSGRRHPVNKIILGPTHTLHNNDGSLATKLWWYEPQYQGPVNLYNENNKIALMYKYMTNFRNLLGRSNYAPELIQAVLRYVRALDTRDWDDSFLRLWSVLEHLTGTLFESYKVTTRRASYMFADREYALQVLSHLKDYRNKSIHAGSQSSDIEALMYQLKKYVEVLIEFHIGNKYRFSSVADASEFMDSPNDKKSIDKKISRLRYAKNFISGS